MSDEVDLALITAADDIRAAIDELAGMDCPSDNEHRADFMSDETLRVATVIADHLDPELDDGTPILEKLVAAIRITACPRRHS